MSEKLYIGWAERDITPDMEKYKVGLYGQYYARIATGLHSRLKFSVCAMSSGAESFISGTVDVAGVPLAFTNLLKEEVAKRNAGIDTSRIFLNAIHTHSAPSINVAMNYKRSVGGSMWQQGEFAKTISPAEYAELVLPIMADAIVEAWNTRKEGGIARAFDYARIGHCRRAAYTDGTAEMYGDTTRSDFVAMEAGEDSGVDMLFTLDKEGKKTGVILNVACPSQVMESTYVVSSDFAGATRELLKEDFGPEFHTLYWISPAGCQSPRDLVRHYATEPDFWHADGVAVLAKRLRDAVMRAELEPAEYTPELKSTVVKVSLPRRRASYTDYREAKAELARLEAIKPEAEAFEDFCAETHANEKLDGPGPYDSKLHHFVLIKNAKAVITRYEEQDDQPDLHFDMNVIRLGDIAIANNPFELYLHYGQIIKARSHARQTFLIQLAVGADIHAGYLPSPEGEKLGGYGGLIINGQVGSAGGYKLADVTVESINALFD
ncbi:MAG: hypothetical protein J6S54_12465 [Lentisphaeria bacterium]|nr:hypothetical protein [Lentisphaeria bacterium]